MPNQPSEDVKRLTLTIDKELLARIEKLGGNRLDHMRKALEQYLDTQPTFPIMHLGDVSAGEPIESPNPKIIHSHDPYPPGYFVVTINGRSMEPDLPDGEMAVIKPAEYTPKKNKIAVFSDGRGSIIKMVRRVEGKFVLESINPKFPDLIEFDESLVLQGYFHEILPNLKRWPLSPNPAVPKKLANEKELSFRVKKDGKEIGTLFESQIRDLGYRGELSPDDFYFDLGSNDWVRIGAHPRIW